MLLTVFKCSKKQVISTLLILEYKMLIWILFCFDFFFWIFGLHWDFIQNRFFLGWLLVAGTLLSKFLHYCKKILFLGHICKYIFFVCFCSILLPSLDYLHDLQCMSKGDIICFGAYWEDTSQHTNAFVSPFFLVS